MINYQPYPLQTCNWTGIGGTLVDLNNQHLKGYIVQVTGAGRTVRQQTGANPEYAPSGWELRLGAQQVTGVWRIQLFKATDLQHPVSDVYEIVFTGLCQQNLAFVRFQQNH
jgi:hypothetical protein